MFGEVRLFVRQGIPGVDSFGGTRVARTDFLDRGDHSCARFQQRTTEVGVVEQLHFAFMTVSGKLTEDMAYKVAEKIGLDMDQLRRDMEDPEIDAALQRNYDLAQALQINGTPAFVIGDEIVRGAIDMRALRQIVGRTRANSS